jgi:hypothetical protein
MRAQLLFWVVPLVEGQLVIEGIGFKLCGMLWGQSNFINLHKCFVGGGGGGGGQLHSSTAGAGYSSLSASSSASPPASEPSSPADNNAIHVVGTMPLIEVRIRCVWSSCVAVCGRC